MGQVRSEVSRLGSVAAPVRSRLRPYRQLLQRARREGVGVSAQALGRTSFSQFGEDLFLSGCFSGERHGFYVDVGAFHPFRWSNTWLLYQRGWHGINVEPDPDAIELFNRFRPRDLNLQLAIAPERGEASLLRRGEYSAIADAHADGTEHVRVRTEPLAAMLDQRLPRGQRIDVLDVDCEGLDLQVLQSNDWTRFRATFVLAEAHDAERVTAITNYMASVGYERTTQLHVTVVFRDVPAPNQEVA